ncbi:MAG: HAD hydrolase-like protein [Candidatus Nezhaarchaeales archaeon]
MLVKAVVVNLDSALLKVDVSEVERRLKQVLGVDGGLKRLIMEALKSPDKAKLNAVCEILDAFEAKTAEEAEIDQEDLEALCVLKAIGVKLALVTMRGRMSTERILERIGLEGVFDVVVTRDEESEKALQIARACGNLGYRASETLYVGFSTADAIIGLQAGCLVATPHRVLQALDRTIKVSSLHQLLNVFMFTAPSQ